MPPTLINATPSAYARMNRIAFMEKQVDFVLKDEVPWNAAETETPTHNPLEKLPILILEDGSVIYDSILIQDYILHTYAKNGPTLIPSDWKGSSQARQIQTLAQGQMDAMALSFFEMNREVKSPEWASRQNRKVIGAMRAYDAYVKAAKGGWVVAGEYSIADIAIGCAAEWVDFFMDLGNDFGKGEGWDWRKDYPDLAAWLAKVSERETFKATVPVMFDIKDKIV